jgi:hypothetical protein
MLFFWDANQSQVVGTGDVVVVFLPREPDGDAFYVVVEWLVALRLVRCGHQPIPRSLSPHIHIT